MMKYLFVRKCNKNRFESVGDSYGTSAELVGVCWISTYDTSQDYRHMER